MMKILILTYCGFNLLILGSTLPHVHDIKGVKSHSLSHKVSLSLLLCVCMRVRVSAHSPVPGSEHVTSLFRDSERRLTVVQVVKFQDYLLPPGGRHRLHR